MIQTLSSLQDVQERYRWFQHMRNTHPVWLDESSKCWHVFRYEDVNNVITDYTLFSSEFRRPAFRRTTSAAASLISMDPPQHRRYRNLISSAFTPKAIAALSGRITEIVQELLDEVRAQGRMDVITDLAYPLPTIVIAEMLGVPTSDRPLFKRWADGLLSRQLSDAELFSENVTETESFKQARQASEEMADYFKHILTERRQHPQDDMMSKLLAAEVDGSHLSMDEVISFCILLLLAGHVTTTNLLGQAILRFDEFNVIDQLRNQPDLMPTAIEEVLRFASPVWRLVRSTTQDVTIDNTVIPQGAVVFAWLASANRDERQFPEPEKFDITRNPNKHIAFGHGIHFCIGAPLARLEAGIALPMMLEQLPQLRRNREEPLELLDSRILFGVKHLPVTFTAG